MPNTPLSIGSYGLIPATHSSIYEDEYVGSQPPYSQGVVVTRVADKKIFVRDWHINSHFNGHDCLKKFEEAKHKCEFTFAFSHEREHVGSDPFDGTDSVLKAQLIKQLP